MDTLNLLRRLLGPLQPLYGGLTGLEKGFFAAFPFLVHRSAARVVSVGNLTVGGTGKTPVLLACLRELLGQGEERVVVSTRGYRSPWERGFLLISGSEPVPSELTDEAVLLHERFPDLPVLVGKNRAHAVRIAERLLKPRWILLDDGFQYRRLRKDVDFVLWDATEDPGLARLLPAGRLREPIECLGRATAILLTRCEQIDDATRANRMTWFRSHVPQVPVVGVQTVIEGWVSPDGRSVPANDGPREGVAFAAIGNPDSFSRQLALGGVQVRDQLWFRDHHRFSAADCRTLGHRQEQVGLPLLCTEKDRVKLPSDWLCRHHVWTVRIGVVCDAPGSFARLMHGAAAKNGENSTPSR